MNASITIHRSQNIGQRCPAAPTRTCRDGNSGVSPPLHTAAYSEKPSPNRTQHFVQLIETAAQTCTEFTHAIDGGT